LGIEGLYPLEWYGTQGAWASRNEVPTSPLGLRMVEALVIRKDRI